MIEEKRKEDYIQNKQKFAVVRTGCGAWGYSTSTDVIMVPEKNRVLTGISAAIPSMCMETETEEELFR